MIFCDTSALAKYYVLEAESAALASRLDAEDAVVVSELARVELMIRRNPGVRSNHAWACSEPLRVGRRSIVFPAFRCARRSS